MRLVMTLVVRDESEIIADQLDYHLARGIHFVIATDHRSRDGTREILEEYERKGVLQLIREDGEYLQQGAWQTRMARLAAVRYEADWIITSDADEFWWPSGESIEESLAAVPAEFGVVRAATQNFVPLLDDGGWFAERMIFRLAANAPINDPATPYRPAVKVAHRAGPDVVFAGAGAHQVSGVPGGVLASWSALDVLHFPLRTREQCGRKYRKTRTGWETNLRADLFRAVRAEADGRADVLWDRVALDSMEVGRGLRSGLLVSDTRLRDAFRAMRGDDSARTSVPSSRGSTRPSELDMAVFEEAELVRAARRADDLDARLGLLEYGRHVLPSSAEGPWRGAGRSERASSRRLAGWARSLLAPRKRLLPGVGYRLERHPRLAAAVFLTLRRLPGRQLRSLAYLQVSRPLAERMSAQLVVSVDRGLRMRVDMGDAAGRVLATSGVWEPYVVATLARELGPGDVYVDAGAHVGFHALVASRIVGPQGHVYAVEPTAATYRQLCVNLELNGVSNVTALPLAAGESEGRGVMVDAEADNTGAFEIRELAPSDAGWAAPTSVPVRPLAALIDSAHIARLRLVKIDVEGFEAQVLRGLEPVLEAGARPSLIVELHPRGVERATEELGRMSESYGLIAYEIVRQPRRDRFAPAPPPRAITRVEEMLELASERPVNVLLTPMARVA